jgi:2-(1,2-epoxy-1,2-dihydrophenyl)acetyl-CoA isomerase
MILDISGGIARVTLDRPELGNVLSSAAALELGEAVRRIESDPGVRVVVLAATGDIFCAGGDIREFVGAGERLPQLIGDGLVQLNATLARLHALPVPVVAALKGPVAGGGIGLALTADIALAADTVRFRSGYGAIGLSPDAGTSFFLTRLLGPKRATEFLLSNRFIEAPEALALGLVSRIVPLADLEAETESLVRSLAAGAPGAQAAVKALVREAWTGSHESVLALERDFMIANAASADSREGVTAFLERRAPAFASANCES